jgi:cytochrome c peroxidase
MKIALYILLALCFILLGFREIENQGFQQPLHFPKPVYDFSKNPLTDDKIQLGRALFYESKLSRDNTISCASCHSQFSAFTHVDHALSHGIEDRIGTRNSPALMNLAWQKLFMWDGAINHLDVQALAPIHNALEMDETLANVIKKLQASPVYPQLYHKAFGDSIITGEHTLKAISQFMLTLVSSSSKYDSVLMKKATFSEKEKRGYSVFKKNCASCHHEPLFTNDQFMNNGLKTDSTLNDFGRYTVTRKPSDSLKFKVPTLRNIEFSYPYMHDGRFKKLGEVINHYTSEIEVSETLSKELKKRISLSSNEKVELIAFLLTLTDKSFLFNPDYFYPKQLFYPAPKD